MLTNEIHDYLKIQLRNRMILTLGWITGTERTYDLKEIADETMFDMKFLQDNFNEIVSIFREFDEVLDVDSDDNSNIDVYFKPAAVCAHCSDLKNRGADCRSCQCCDVWRDFADLDEIEQFVEGEEVSAEEELEEAGYFTLEDCSTAREKVDRAIDRCLQSLRKQEKAICVNISKDTFRKLKSLEESIANILNNIVKAQIREDKLSLVCGEIAELAKDIDPYEFYDQCFDEYHGGNAQEALSNLADTIYKDTTSGRCSTFTSKLREWSESSDLSEPIRNKAFEILKKYLELV